MSALSPETVDVPRYHGIDAIEARSPAGAESPIFSGRWSPRSMSGEPIADVELAALLEAARWAPSASNNQPWRILYARRDSPAWHVFVDLLNEGNRDWVRDAALLVVIASKRTFDRNGMPSRTHSFDAGAAWMSLALQAFLLGLVAHGMEGFNYSKARQVLGVPEEYDVEAMVAIGRPGDIERLSERNRAREKPNGRKPVDEIAREGGWWER